MVFDRRYHVVFTRKENRRTCFEEEEGSFIFHESNHENSSPSPAVPPRAPRRAFPNTLGLTFNCGPLHRLGCRRISSVGWYDSGPPNHWPLEAVLWDHRTNIPWARDGTMLNVPSSDCNDELRWSRHGPILPTRVSLPAKHPRVQCCTGLIYGGVQGGEWTTCSHSPHIFLSLKVLAHFGPWRSLLQS